MQNCSKCGAEVEAGGGFCLACGTFLAADGSPATATEAPKRVALTTFNSSDEAARARARLQSAGIPVFDDDSGGADNAEDWFPAGTSIQVFVLDSDAARARRIIADPAPTAEARTPADSADQPTPAVPPQPLPTEAKLPAISAAELASLTPFEILRKLESQLSCLMDDNDVPGWTINPAYHPDVNAFIEANSGNSLFAKKARALQQNRAGYFSTMRAREKTAPAPAKDPFVETRPDPVQTPLSKPEAPSGDITETPPAPTAEVGEEVRQPAVEPAAVPQPKTRRWRRKIAIAASLLILIPVGLLLGASIYFKEVGGQRLQEVLAELDAKEPDWCWGAILSQQKPLEAEQNSAVLVAELARELPADWPSSPSLKEALDYDPTDKLTDEQVDTLQAELEKHQSALAKIEELARPALGRYPARPLDEVLSEPPAYVERARALTNLLRLDAALLARSKRADDALLRARAILNVGRSMGDDPDVQAQLYRIEARVQACACIERTLGHGEAFAEDLVPLQEFLAEEQRQPILLYALRGYRAQIHEILRRVEDNLPGDFIPAREHDFVFALADRESPVGQAEHWLKVGWVQDNHALNLELMTRAVDLAKLPFDKQLAPGELLDVTVKRLHEDWRSALARRSLPQAIGTMHAYHRSQAELRCAMVALAVERYRLDHGGWPRSLELLVPDYLDEAPRDPYDQKQLRLRRFPGGVMVYSVGPDGKDNRGSFDRTDPYLIDRDVGFRLWEVAKRPPPKIVWPPHDEQDEWLRKMEER